VAGRAGLGAGGIVGGVIRTVYIDTTIPSLWADPRPRSALRREITRTWWERQRPRYEVYTSPVVFEELDADDYPWRNAARNLIQPVPPLDVTDAVRRIAAIYRRHRLAPEADPRDSIHLAIASVYRIDCLLTWNCGHLANANKMVHFRVVSEREGLWMPLLATPEQLTEERDDEKA
jgi:predicted nucleic acid-binding protein